MQCGDVISTPQWQYNDRGKDGSGPMIWLDGLDFPNSDTFPSTLSNITRNRGTPPSTLKASPLSLAVGENESSVRRAR
jgi:gentisate 1,2-dioxygenase